MSNQLNKKIITTLITDENKHCSPTGKATIRNRFSQPFHEGEFHQSLLKCVYRNNAILDESINRLVYKNSAQD